MIEDNPTRVLVEKAQGGDPGAFGELFEKYRSRVAGLIHARMGAALQEKLEVDDVLQETFTRAFESIGRFTWRGDESFMRWLGTIAENFIIKSARKHAPKVGLTGCLPDGFFELWTLPGVGHVPNFIPDGEANAAGRHMIDWLLQHSRGPVPVAAITGVPSVGVAPMEVIAHASGSTAAAGTTIRSACWDFGDDSTVNALTAGHTYEAPGRHLVRLLVISDEGAVSAAVEQPVTVTCPRGELGPWTGLQIGEEVYPGAARFAGAVEDSEFLICGGGSGLLTRRWLSPARPRQSTC